MKKTPFLTWHIFYCTTILLLSYLYYNATFGQAQFDTIFETRNAFRKSNDLRDSENGHLLREIQKAAHDTGDTTNQRYLKATNEYVENSKILCDYLKDIQDELFENTGGLDIRYTDGRMINCKSYFPTFSFFDKKKNEEIQEAIAKYEDNKNLIISKLSKDIVTYLQINTIVPDSTFWDRLANDSPANALLKLEELRHRVKYDEARTLNIFFSQVGVNCIYCGQPRLVLLTEQINVENQDYLEGYVSLMDNAFICKARGIEFYANGKKLPSKIGERGAYLKYMPTKQGKNKINLECRIQNPLSKEWNTVKSKVYFYAK